MAGMKEMHHDEGAFSVGNDVAEALERLAVALSSARMSAHLMLKTFEGETTELTLGIDRTSGRRHGLRAKPSEGEGSHFGWEDA